MTEKEALGIGRSLSFKKVEVAQETIYPKDGQAKNGIWGVREEAEINPFIFFDTGYLFVCDKPKFAFEARALPLRQTPGIFLFSVLSRSH